MTEKVVTNAFGRWMWRRGWAGFTAPLPFVTLILYWCLPGYVPHPRTIAHERRHAKQIEQYGWFGFAIRYLGQIMKYGYRMAPFEVSAREAEDAEPRLVVVK